MKISRSVPVLVAVAALGLAGCSAQTETTTTTETTATASATPSTTSPTVTETESPSTTAATETTTATETATATVTETTGGRLDVNAASEEEIASRLEQAGVPDAATWAKRIKENGPYTADNVATKLRELAQQNPVDLTTLNKIREALGY